MTPTNFPESNAVFGPPPGLEESQVRSIQAYRGHAMRGSVDSLPLVVVAWRPSAEEVARLQAGQPVFITMMGGLVPHFLSTSFEQAIDPA